MSVCALAQATEMGNGGLAVSIGGCERVQNCDYSYSVGRDCCLFLVQGSGGKGEREAAEE